MHIKVKLNSLLIITNVIYYFYHKYSKITHLDKNQRFEFRVILKGVQTSLKAIQRMGLNNIKKLQHLIKKSMLNKFFLNKLMYLTNDVKNVVLRKMKYF